VREIWQKFVFLVALSGTTTTIAMPIGPIRAHPQTRAFFGDLMREVVAVGRAHGVDLAENYADVRLQLADDVAPDMTSSMHHDLERGNPLEVRWLAGGVVELGKAKGRSDAVEPRRRRHPGVARVGQGAMTLPAAPLPALTLRGVRTVAVECRCATCSAPAPRPCARRRFCSVDVDTEQGIVGRTYIFCYRRSGARSIAQVVEEAAELVRGERVAPLAMATTLERATRCSASPASCGWRCRRSTPPCGTPSPSLPACRSRRCSAARRGRSAPTTRAGSA
jgi:hypothetical protein